MTRTRITLIMLLAFLAFAGQAQSQSTDTKDVQIARKKLRVGLDTAKYVTSTTHTVNSGSTHRMMPTAKAVYDAIIALGGGGGGGGGHIILDDDTAMDQRAGLNFISTPTVSAALTDDAGNDETEVRLTVPNDGIGANQIAANAVGNSEMADNAIGTAEVTDNSLAAADLAVNVVSSIDGVTNDGGDVDLVAGAGITITPNDAANTITIASSAGNNYQTFREDGTNETQRANANFIDGSIITFTLTDDAVNTETEITAGIVANSIGSGQIGTDAIGSDEIAANAVGNSEMADNAIGTAEVTDNSLAAADLAVNVVSSLDGVTNDGGDIDLVAGAGITITPNDAANTITIAASAGGGFYQTLLDQNVATAQEEAANFLQTATIDWSLAQDAGNNETEVTANVRQNSLSDFHIATDAIGTDELGVGAVYGENIDNMGANSGEVLKWNGSTWAPGTDNTAGGAANYQTLREDGVAETQRENANFLDGSIITFTLTDDAVNTETEITAGIVANSIGSGQIGTDAVGSDEIAANAVGNSEMADNAIGTAEVTDNSLAAADLAVNVVSSLDGVTNDGADIDLVAGAGITITPNDAANTITIASSAGNNYQTFREDGTNETQRANANFIDGSIITFTLTDDAVNTETEITAGIVANSIGSGQIGTDAVGSDEIAANAVGNSEMADNAIGTAEVTDNSLAAADLAVNVVSSLDGVTNDGGDIDLVAGAGITITPNDAANTITIASSAGNNYQTFREDGTDETQRANANFIDGSIITFTLTDDAVSTETEITAGIVANSIGSGQIGTDAVGSDEIAANAVGNSEMADNAIGTAEVTDNSLAAADLAVNVVSSLDGVTNDGADIDLVAGAGITITPNDAANTITIASSAGNNYQTFREDGTNETQRANANFIDGSIITFTLTDDAVNTETEITAGIVANSIGSGQIGTDAVGSDEIAANAVGNSEMADNAIGTAEVTDNTLAAADLAVNVVSSLDGVTNDGGDIDLVAGTGITITPNDAANTITIEATGGGGGGDINQGGNSFGVDINIGSNDNFSVSLEQNGTRFLTGGTDKNVTIINEVAATAATTDRLKINTNSTGAAANGFGGAILFNAESSTTDDQELARITGYWGTVSHAAREGIIGFQLGDNGGALAEIAKFDRSTATGRLTVGTTTPIELTNGGISANTNFILQSGTSAMSFNRSPATTNSPVSFVFGVASTGTAGNGFGNRIELEAETSTNAVQDAAYIDAVWTDATNGTRTSDFVVQTVNSATIGEAFRLYGNKRAMVGGGTNQASAAFQVNSTTGGILPPKVTTTEMNAIATPTEGLSVYNTTEKGDYKYDGANWRLSSHEAITGRLTGQTAAVASVATLTVGSNDATYTISGNINVTTSSAEAFSISVDYTDETNTARNAIIPILRSATGAWLTQTLSALGASPYPCTSVQIRAKASTAITIKTSGTFTGCTYNVEGSITRVN